MCYRRTLGEAPCGIRMICVSLLALTFFIAKTQQQRFKLIKRLLLIGPDRLDDDTVAAIQIGGKHSQYAGGREILLAFANRNHTRPIALSVKAPKKVVG